MSIGARLLNIAIGRPTPAPWILACAAGMALGFLPGTAQAPGTLAVLLGILLLGRVNWFLAAGSTVAGCILSFLLAPLAHAVGVGLLEGPTAALFRPLVNAPFFAWCGLEYHAVTGGLAVGALLGVVAGVFLVRASRKLVAWQGASDEVPLSSAMTLLSRVLWGETITRGKELRDGASPGWFARPIGSGIVVVVALIILFTPQSVSGPILGKFLRGGLEQANGATVDLDDVGLDVTEGKLTLNGLAVADRTDITRDFLRANTVSADVDLGELLARRWRIEELTIERAKSGVRRDNPARTLGDRPIDVPTTIPDAPDGTKIVTLDDLLASVDEWEERLLRVQDLIDMIVGNPDAEEAPVEAPISPLWTRAVGLLRETPTVQVDKLRIVRLEALQIGETPLVIEGWNLSTHPELVDEPAGFSIASDDGSFRFVLDPPLTAESARPAGEHWLEFARRGISGDAVGEVLTYRGTPLVSGGTIDLVGGGRWWREGGVRLDIPLELVLRGCSIRVPGSDDLESVEELRLPLRLGGQLLAPLIQFRGDDLIDALVSSGKRELASRARQELGRKVDEETERLKERLGEALDDELGDALGDEAKKAIERFGGSLIDQLGGGDDR